MQEAAPEALAVAVVVGLCRFAFSLFTHEVNPTPSSKIFMVLIFLSRVCQFFPLEEVGGRVRGSKQ